MVPGVPHPERRRNSRRRAKPRTDRTKPGPPCTPLILFLRSFFPHLDDHSCLSPSYPQYILNTVSLLLKCSFSSPPSPHLLSFFNFPLSLPSSTKLNKFCAFSAMRAVLRSACSRQVLGMLRALNLNVEQLKDKEGKYLFLKGVA
eukprot:2925007-Rhodomonas_salina.2